MKYERQTIWTTGLESVLPLRFIRKYDLQFIIGFGFLSIGIVINAHGVCAASELPGISTADNSKHLSTDSNTKNVNTTILWKSKFDSLPVFNGWQIKKIYFGERNYQIVHEEEGTHPFILRVSYPKGSWSPRNTMKSGIDVGGMGFRATCGIEPQDKLHLRYYVRFPTGFQFVKGGKLPGLYGGKGNSGGKQPNGRDGFSVRLMWRRNGDGEVYAYLPHTKNKWGTSIGRSNWRFEPGQWYLIEEAVTLNTPGKADGQIRLWVSENLVVEQTELTFRDIPKLKIDGIMFSTFFGGNDKSWATPVTTYVDFADFALSDDYIGLE
jgi:hypothetical protein